MTETPLHATIFIRVSNYDKDIYTVHAALSEMPEVGLITATAGPYDLFLLAVAQNSVLLGELLDRISLLDGVETALKQVVLSEVEPVNWFAKQLAANKKD